MSCVMTSDKDNEFSFADEYRNWNKNRQNLKNLIEKRTEFYHRIETEIKNAEVVVGKDITEKFKPILEKIKNKINFDKDVFNFLGISGFDKSGLCKYFIDDNNNEFENKKCPFKFTFYKYDEDKVVISYEEQSTQHFGKYGLINIPSYVFENFLTDDEIADYLYKSLKEAIKEASSKLHSCMKD